MLTRPSDSSSSCTAIFVFVDAIKWIFQYLMCVLNKLLVICHSLFKFYSYDKFLSNKTLFKIKLKREIKLKKIESYVRVCVDLTELFL